MRMRFTTCFLLLTAVTSYSSIRKEATKDVDVALEVTPKGTLNLHDEGHRTVSKSDSAQDAINYLVAFTAGGNMVVIDPTASNANFAQLGMISGAFNGGFSPGAPSSSVTSLSVSGNQAGYVWALDKTSNIAYLGQPTDPKNIFSSWKWVNYSLPQTAGAKFTSLSANATFVFATMENRSLYQLNVAGTGNWTAVAYPSASTDYDSTLAIISAGNASLWATDNSGFTYVCFYPCVANVNSTQGPWWTNRGTAGTTNMKMYDVGGAGILGLTFQNFLLYSANTNATFSSLASLQLPKGQTKALDIAVRHNWIWIIVDVTAATDVSPSHGASASYNTYRCQSPCAVPGDPLLGWQLVLSKLTKINSPPALG